MAELNDEFIVFDDFTSTALHVASVVENNIHVCIGTILTGLHLLTLCTCTTIWYPHLASYLVKPPEVFKAIGGTENLTSSLRVERDIRFNFPHPYCGGNLSEVDIAVLQLWESWPFTTNFGVSQLHLDLDRTYFDYIFEVKHLSNPSCQSASWWWYDSVQAPMFTSPRLGSTGKLQFVDSDVVDSSFCLPFYIEVLGEKHAFNKLPELFKNDKLCVLHQLGQEDPVNCGVDKGSPLTCYMENVGWKLYGIGLGGTGCTIKQSVSLFQGFSNSLSFMRLYLGFDLTVRGYSHTNMSNEFPL